MNRIRLRYLCLAFVLLLSACSSAPSYSGQWLVSANDTRAGYGEGNLTISQSGNQLSGSWQLGFAGTLSGGSLQGTANGNAVTVQLYPSDPTACPFNVTATRSGNTMIGNYASFNCTGVISGTLTAVKR